MAKLDDLIGQVSDRKLRDELVGAAKELRKQKRFGLVFEEHIPETTSLHDFPVKAGATVHRRDDRNAKTPLRVETVKGHTATVMPPKGPAEEVPVDELLVLKRFGDPIYPALKPLGKVERGTGRPHHAVIDGENFHALQLLTFLYEGQVDCMYLDPPYNTGASDWKYNNNYVDRNDAWRHSKWLSMMAKRLRLAKRLMKEDGVLIVTIDEHEVEHLGVLLRQMFPKAYKQLVTIVTNPKGVTQAQGFSRVDEYGYFIFLGGASVTSFGDDLLSPEVDDKSEDRRPRWKGLLRSGDEARRQDRTNMFYPVLIDAERCAVLGVGDPLLDNETPDFSGQIDGLTPVWPVRRDGSLGRWSVGHHTLRNLIGKGYVALGEFDKKRNSWGITYLSQQLREQVDTGVLVAEGFDKRRNLVDVRFVEEKKRRIKTVWRRTSHDAGAYGSDLLRAFLGGERRFSFPKSLYAVHDSLAAVVGTKPDALIVDVFAGSGTTLHATLMLNALDDGNRRCVLVTNNELSAEDEARLRRAEHFPGDAKYEAHGIFEAVARPRCKAAISGKLADGSPVPGAYRNGIPYAAGFEQNCSFFRMDYLEPDEIELGRQFEDILPSLWLAAGGIGPWPDASGEEQFVLPARSPFGVLLRESAFRKFADALAARPDVTHIWLVTDSERAFADMRAALPGERTVSMLYRDYLRNFEINTVRNI